MNKLFSSICLFIITVLTLASFSVAWSQTNDDIPPETESSNMFTRNSGKSLADYGCGYRSENFAIALCRIIGAANSYQDVLTYMNRCGSSDDNPYHDIESFLENTQCKRNLLDDNEYPVIDNIVTNFKNQRFFDFYKELIKHKLKASKDNNYDQLKKVVAILNKPNQQGQTVLDFMEYYWNEKLDIPDYQLGYSRERMHNLCCLVGCEYKQHPELNQQCLAKRKSIYVD